MGDAAADSLSQLPGRPQGGCLVGDLRERCDAFYGGEPSGMENKLRSSDVLKWNRGLGRKQACNFDGFRFKMKTKVRRFGP